jgi:hypothetical protein
MVPSGSFRQRRWCRTTTLWAALWRANVIISSRPASATAVSRRGAVDAPITCRTTFLSRLRQGPRSSGSLPRAVGAFATSATDELDWNTANAGSTARSPSLHQPSAARFIRQFPFNVPEGCRSRRPRSVWVLDPLAPPTRCRRSRARLGSGRWRWPDGVEVSSLSLADVAHALHRRGGNRCLARSKPAGRCPQHDMWNVAPGDAPRRSQLRARTPLWWHALSSFAVVVDVDDPWLCRNRV